MKNILSYTLFLAWGLLIVSCTKQDYFEPPVDENGRAIITTVSSATSDGVTMADDSFTVTAYLPNAKPGDVMTTEILKNQVHPEAGNVQLLPLDGTQKEVTVDSDLKTTVTYSRQEAQLNEPGDEVLVTFAGKTESAQLRITLEP